MRKINLLKHKLKDNISLLKNESFKPIAKVSVLDLAY